MSNDPIEHHFEINADSPRSVFWDDLAEDLKDRGLAEEYAKEYAEASRRLNADASTRSAQQSPGASSFNRKASK